MTTQWKFVEFTEHIKAAFEHVDTPVWIFDFLERRMVYANELAVTLWRKNSLEHLLTTDFTSISEATALRMENYLKEFERTGKTISDPWTFYPNGQAISVDCTCKPILVEGHICILAQCHWSPKYEESQLKGVRMAEALRHIPVAVSLFDIHGKGVLENPRAEALYGPDTDFYSRFVSEEQAARCKALLAEGKTFKEDAEVRTCEGRIRWHEVEARATKDPADGKEAILVHESNIEERRNLVQMMLEKERALIDSDLKSKFMAEMSHEIRTPLHGILGMTQLLRDTALSHSQSELVEMLHISATSLLSTINNVLKLSRIEGHSKAPQLLTWLPIRAAVEDAATTVYGKAQLQNIEVTWYVEPSVPPLLLSNGEFVQQCLLNLLGNAIKFSPPNTTVAISAKLMEEGVLFEVADQGPGISPTWTLDDLCKPYLRAEERIEGTGLGLSITRKLVAEMGGTLAMKSQLGAGSTFSFTIPLVRPPEDKVLDPPNAPGSPMLRKTAQHSSLDVLSPTNSLVLKPSTSTNAFHQSEEVAHEQSLGQPLPFTFKVQVATTAPVLTNMLTTTLRTWGLHPATKPLTPEGIEADAEGVEIFIVDTHDLNENQFKALVRSPVFQKIPFPAIIYIVRPKDIKSFQVPPDAPSWKFQALVKPIRRFSLKQCFENLQRFREPHSPQPIIHNKGRINTISKEYPLRIMVAEDDVVNQVFIQKILSRLGYQPIVVGNGQILLDSLDSNSCDCDLIFMDLNMPVMDGLEATRQIHLRWKDEKRPVIVGMTASTIGVTEEVPGMDDCLTKPTGVDVLVETLKKWSKIRQEQRL